MPPLTLEAAASRGSPDSGPASDRPHASEEGAHRAGRAARSASGGEGEDQEEGERTHRRLHSRSFVPAIPSLLSMSRPVSPKKAPTASRRFCILSEDGRSAQAFAGSVLASAAFLHFSGTSAQESAGAIPEQGALTEGFAALTSGVPALAHAWGALAHVWAALPPEGHGLAQAWGRAPQNRYGLAQAWGRAAQTWAGPYPAWARAPHAWGGAPQAWAEAPQALGKSAQAWGKN
jgi:hypothetical protein